VRSTYHEQNARGRAEIAVAAGVTAEDRELCFDPQTSGGLLFGVEAARASEAVRELREAGDRDAAVIGSVFPPRSDRSSIELIPGKSCKS
jgi:selenide,water dikinase